MPDPKYPYTKEVVDAARKEGMTQIEIAKLCRIQQSTVSGWSKGEKIAPIHVIKPLIEKYGTQINKKHSRVYFAYERRYIINDTVLSLCAEHAESLKTHLGEIYNTQQEFFQVFEKTGVVLSTKKKKPFEPSEKDKLLDSAYSEKESIVQVEGKIIFKYHFQRKTDQQTNKPGSRTKLFTWQRWIIHELGAGELTWVVQIRREIKGCLIDTLYDDAKWKSLIMSPRKPEEIIQRAEKYIAQENFDVNNFNDKAVLPFLLRKSFIENGYYIEGIEKILAK
ncbi:MAG TPA: XRE family transcriptional regulator [Thiotrichaceae bacterium]|nr:XRE family transcriptional regulator [Thiotrichaceae bacterium]